MRVLIVGNGMYVRGQGQDNFGTVLPALIEYQHKNNQVLEVDVVGTNSKSSLLAKQRFSVMKKLSSSTLKIRFFPDKKQKETYLTLMNKNRYDCAIVSVPDHLHFKISKKILEKSIPALIVKPFTTTVKEGLELINLAKNNKIYGAVEFHKRFDKQNILLKNHIEEGKIGDLLYSNTEYSQRKSIPMNSFKKWSNKTNIFQYLGVHYVDLMRFITNATPTKVLATGQKKFLLSKKINTYDAIQVMIEWKKRSNSFMQYISVNWIDPENSSAMSEQKINFIGTKGRLEANQKDRGLIFFSDEEKIKLINPDFSMAFKDTDRVSWRGYGIQSINTFLSDVEDLKNKETSLNKLIKKRPTYEEALFSTGVIEAVNNSLKEGSQWKLVEFK
jgi:predicted dehydrogenase